MHYVFTFFGILLEAVTVALLQLFGETYTSETVFKVVTFLAIIFVIVGVIMAVYEEKGAELAKALLIHALIIVVGFALVWLLTLSLIIGFGAIVLGIMLAYFLIVTI